MNKHIELVKKWLADPDSVTKKELRANDADAAAYANDAAAAANAAYAAYAAYTADAAAYTAAAAASAAASGLPLNADNWVKEYEKLSKSN